MLRISFIVFNCIIGLAFCSTPKQDENLIKVEKHLKSVGWDKETINYCIELLDGDEEKLFKKFSESYILKGIYNRSTGFNRYQFPKTIYDEAKNLRKINLDLAKGLERNQRFTKRLKDNFENQEVPELKISFREVSEKYQLCSVESDFESILYVFEIGIDSVSVIYREERRWGTDLDKAIGIINQHNPIIFFSQIFMNGSGVLTDLEIFYSLESGKLKPILVLPAYVYISDWGLPIEQDTECNILETNQRVLNLAVKYNFNVRLEGGNYSDENSYDIILEDSILFSHNLEENDSLKYLLPNTNLITKLQFAALINSGDPRLFFCAFKDKIIEKILKNDSFFLTRLKPTIKGVQEQIEREDKRSETEERIENKVFIEAVANKTQMKPGEIIEIKYTLYSKLGMRNKIEPEFNDYDDFEILEMNIPTTFKPQSIQKNGETFTSWELGKIKLKALSTGTIEIDPVELSIEVGTEPNANEIDSETFSNYIYSKPLEIKVSLGRN